MRPGRGKRFADLLHDLFPARLLAIHSGDASHAIVLTPGRQMAGAALALAGALWLGAATTAGVAGVVTQVQGGTPGAQARLASALARLNATSTSAEALAARVEKRDAALAAMIAGTQIVQLKPSLTPISVAARTPAERLAAAGENQDRLVEAADTFARNRAERLRLAFRLAGLNPAAYEAHGAGVGGPFISAKDPRALAAMLDVNADFARRVRHAAVDLSNLHGLAVAAQTTPFARPADNVTESSGFGERSDPFTGEPAFHTGQDFAGAFKTPIKSTAPGVVSFAGLRSGYGNTVEIDHGHGLKTRYGHLEAISVTVGERVALGQQIGAMGSTGRSTGDHLHYEVWVDGRPQNPLRFVKAGDYVQQTQ